MEIQIQTIGSKAEDVQFARLVTQIDCTGDKQKSERHEETFQF